MEDVLLFTHLLPGVVGFFLSIALIGVHTIQDTVDHFFFELALRFVFVLQLLAWIFSISVAFAAKANWVLLRPHVKFHWFTWLLSTLILAFLPLFTSDSLAAPAFWISIALLILGIVQILLADYAQTPEKITEESVVPLSLRQQYILFTLASLLPVFTNVTAVLIVIQLWGVVSFGLSWHLRLVTKSSRAYNRRLAWIFFADAVITLILETINVILLVVVTNGLSSISILATFFWFIGIAAGYFKAVTAIKLHAYIRNLTGSSHSKHE